jgi:hypothetical protein
MDIRGSFPSGKADHTSPSSTKVKNGGAIPPLPDASTWHRDNFTFTFMGKFLPMRSYFIVLIIAGQTFVSVY